MKPVSIPERLRHEHEGFKTITIAAPPGTESTISPVEAEVGESPKFGPVILVLMRITGGEMAVLEQNHGLFWFCTIGDFLRPFSMSPVSVSDAEGIDPDSMEAHLFVDEQQNVSTPEDIARAFHEVYERLAPDFGYKTREESAKPWEEVPEQNKALMTAVVTELFF